MLQFVSANGPGFVKANDWVAPFILDNKTRNLPPNVAVYLYATNRPGGRSTGEAPRISVPDEARDFGGQGSPELDWQP